MTNRFSNMFDDVFNNQREDEYCDKCELCIRNSLIPSRGQGLEGSGTIMHLVTAPSPADRKTKYILSGRTGAFVRRILEDKKLLALSYITSVVKCGTSQTVDSKAITECFPRLQKEIARVEPSMFITYGKDPYFIISGGKKLPKNGEGIDMLPNGKIHIYTISLEQMRKINDYSYLDRAYDTAIIAYRKFVNQWVIFK